MPEYITGFTLYTLAMIGVIFIALVVVKKSLAIAPMRNKNNFMKVESTLNIEPRKNLYVIKAGEERFLISSSGENCSFMTKLEGQNNEEILNQVQDDDINKVQDDDINQLQENNIEQNYIEPFPEDIEMPEMKRIRGASKYFTGAF